MGTIQRDAEDEYVRREDMEGNGQGSIRDPKIPLGRLFGPEEIDAQGTQVRLTKVDLKVFTGYELRGFLPLEGDSITC